MKTCPYCAEDIKDAAIVCKHCGRELTADVPPKEPDKPWSSEEHVIVGILIVVAAALIVSVPFCLGM